MSVKKITNGLQTSVYEMTGMPDGQSVPGYYDRLLPLAEQATELETLYSN